MYFTKVLSFRVSFWNYFFLISFPDISIEWSPLQNMNIRPNETIPVLMITQTTWGHPYNVLKRKWKLHNNKQTKKGGELPDRTLFEFDRWKQGKEKSYLLPTSPVFGPYVTVNAGLFFWP